MFNSFPKKPGPYVPKGGTVGKVLAKLSSKDFDATWIGALVSGGYGAQECFPIAISDTTTALTTGTVPITFHFPYAFALTKVKAGVNTVSSSGIPTFDVKKNGTSVFTTKVTIDAGENHSSTAATAAVLTSTPLSIASADAITFSIDVAGTGTKQAVIYLIGYATGAG